MNSMRRNVSMSWPIVIVNERPAPYSLIQAIGWSVFMPFSSAIPPSGITTG